LYHITGEVLACTIAASLSVMIRWIAIVLSSKTSDSRHSTFH